MLTDHANIVSYKEQFIEGGTLFIIMELAEDGDLEKRMLKQKGVLLPEATIVGWFRQICLAMQQVHGCKVLHRDIKSQNIFLTSGGTVIKIGDFGISRVLAATNELARTKVGTPYYLPPEICMSKPYDSKCDIWSMGCLLYELVALKHPFNGNSIGELVRKITLGKYAPPPSSFSPDLRTLIADMLNHDPAKRPDINEVLSRPVMQQPASVPSRPATPTAAVEQRLRLLGLPGGARPASRPASRPVSRPASASPSPSYAMGKAQRPAACPSAAIRAKHPAYCAVHPAARPPRSPYCAPRRADGCLGERRKEQHPAAKGKAAAGAPKADARRLMAQQRAMAGVYA